eukprot:7167972-Prymnesium_polylepis.1
MAPARPQAAPRRNPCLPRPPRRGDGVPPDRGRPRDAPSARRPCLRPHAARASIGNPSGRPRVSQVRGGCITATTAGAASR